MLAGLLFGFCCENPLSFISKRTLTRELFFEPSGLKEEVKQNSVNWAVGLLLIQTVCEDRFSMLLVYITDPVAELYAMFPAI